MPAPPPRPQPRARQHELIFPQQQFLTAVPEGPVCRVSRGHHEPGKSGWFSSRLGLETREMENLPRQRGSSFWSHMSSGGCRKRGDLICKTQPQQRPGAGAILCPPEPPKLLGLEMFLCLLSQRSTRTLLAEVWALGLAGPVRPWVQSTAPALPREPRCAAQGVPVSALGPPSPTLNIPPHGKRVGSPFSEIFQTDPGLIKEGV